MLRREIAHLSRAELQSCIMAFHSQLEDLKQRLTSDFEEQGRDSSLHWVLAGKLAAFSQMERLLLANFLDTPHTPGDNTLTN